MSFIEGKELLGPLRSKSNEEFNRRIISKCEILPTTYLLANMNLLLSLSESYKDEEAWLTQGILIKGLLPETVFDAVTTKPKFSSRVIFHRDQLLTFLSRVLSLGKKSSDSLFFESNNEVKSVGRALLNFNDFLQSPYRHTTSEIVGDLAHSIELSTAFWFEVSIARTIQYLKIFNEICPDFSGDQSLNDFFKANVGLSVEEMLIITLYVWAHYFQYVDDKEAIWNDPNVLNLSRNLFFANTQFSEEQINRYFALSARTIDEMREELVSNWSDFQNDRYVYILFRKFPIIILSEDVFTCIDFRFLYEKFTFGLFRLLFNCLPQSDIGTTKDKNLAGKLTREWGRAVEQYSIQILRDISTARTDIAIKQRKKVRAEPDAILIDNQSLFIIQVKGRYLKGRAKYSGGREFVNDLSDKFGLKKDAALDQLLNDIKCIIKARAENSSYYIVGKSSEPIELSNIQRIIPVLIADESMLSAGLIQHELVQWFQKDIEKQEIPEDLSVGGLVVLHVQALELFESFLQGRSKDSSLARALDFLSRRTYQTPEDTFIANEAILRDFLHREFAIPKDSTVKPSKRSQEAFDKLKAASISKLRS